MPASESGIFRGIGGEIVFVAAFMTVMLTPEAFGQTMDIEVAKNRDVVRQMESVGDNCKEPRAIRHFFYGTSDNIRNLKSALGTKYRFENTKSASGVIVYEFSNCQIEEISRRTFEFVQLSTQYSVEYDGWESAVVGPRN